MAKTHNFFQTKPNEIVDRYVESNLSEHRQNKTEKGDTTVKINVTMPDTVSGVWVQKPPSLALNIKPAG